MAPHRLAQARAESQSFSRRSFSTEAVAAAVVAGPMAQAGHGVGFGGVRMATQRPLRPSAWSSRSLGRCWAGQVVEGLSADALPCESGSRSQFPAPAQQCEFPRDVGVGQRMVSLSYTRAHTCTHAHALIHGLASLRLPHSVPWARNVPGFPGPLAAHESTVSDMVAPVQEQRLLHLPVAATRLNIT